MQVYEDAILRHIKTYRDLSVLAECRLHMPLFGPSWVPHWSEKASPYSTTYRMYASSHLPACCVMPEAVGVLRVAGVSVLAIEHLELFQLEGKINHSENFQEIRTVLARTVACGELTESNSVIEAIAKTLAIHSQGPFSHVMEHCRTSIPVKRL